MFAKLQSDALFEGFLAATKGTGLELDQLESIYSQKAFKIETTDLIKDQTFFEIKEKVGD